MRVGRCGTDRERSVASQTRISVQYEDKDNADEQVKGFVRLQRNF
ncbi:hypothetical protein [Ensifer sp. ENS12]|nr:hypothetical protein [Ensifer sp. ENS12]